MEQIFFTPGTDGLRAVPVGSKVKFLGRVCTKYGTFRNGDVALKAEFTDEEVKCLLKTPNSYDDYRKRFYSADPRFTYPEETFAAFLPPAENKMT